MSSPKDLLERFETPDPPAGLRARSLAAARLAMAQPAPRPDRWTRLWQSRAARLAWAAAVVVLVLGHVALSMPPHPTTVRPGTSLLLAGSIPDLELAATVTLPRLRSNRLPQLDVTIRTVPAEPAGETMPRRDNHDA